MPSLLILQLQIVPAHQRGHLELQRKDDQVAARAGG
jgi:hypothetical protein